MLRAELAGSLGELRVEARIEVDPARCLALVGPSGAGKSSVLRMIAGLLRPRRGRVECDGRVWLDTRIGVELAPERRRCGYMFQDYALFGHLSAWRNVAYAQRGVPRDRRRAAAVELLDRFGAGRLADARPATLSGGERQRVALARALGSQPNALLLDEPLSALDVSTRAKATRELLELLADARVPTVLVTHDFDEAATIADEVAVIEAGRIVQQGTAEELTARPLSAFVADLTGAVVLSGTAAPRPDGLTEVHLDGGGASLSTDHGQGRVAISVHPWEITLEPTPAAPGSSARNRIPARVASVRSVGNRVRVGLDATQPLVAEVTAEARDQLALLPGRAVVASWKATATRIVAAGDQRERRLTWTTDRRSPPRIP
jgi:molybdate transport system ATP-binding protein